MNYLIKRCEQTIRECQMMNTFEGGSTNGRQRRTVCLYKCQFMPESAFNALLIISPTIIASELAFFRRWNCTKHCLFGWLYAVINVDIVFHTKQIYMISIDTHNLPILSVIVDFCTVLPVTTIIVRYTAYSCLEWSRLRRRRIQSLLGISLSVECVRFTAINTPFINDTNHYLINWANCLLAGGMSQLYDDHRTNLSTTKKCNSLALDFQHSNTFEYSLLSMLSSPARSGRDLTHNNTPQNGRRRRRCVHHRRRTIDARARARATQFEYGVCAYYTRHVCVCVC